MHDLMQLSGAITPVAAYLEDAQGNILEKPVTLRFHHGDQQATVELGFELYQNIPNPFSQSTAVGFYLPEAADADFTVLDATGRLLYHQQGFFPKGYNRIVINRDELPAAGLFFYHLATPDAHASKMMRIE
ncbi:MAG: hypothetical protein IPL65_15470 [Lewinellaceae bacterium]|nr:hypothetical protein [Lewinellaceae bacterium]